MINSSSSMTNLKTFVQKKTAKLASGTDRPTTTAGPAYESTGAIPSSATTISTPTATPAPAVQTSSILAKPPPPSGDSRTYRAGTDLSSEERAALNANLWRKETDMQAARAEILRPRALPDATVASRAALSSYQRQPLYVPASLAPRQEIPVT